MAEGLAVASGVMSIVSLAGQVVLGCIALSNFLDDIRDAPAQIRSLASELNTLRKTIDEMKLTTRDAVSEALVGALNDCSVCVAELQSLVGASELLGHRSTGTLMRSRIKVVVRKQRFGDAVERLGRAKLNLLVAQSSFARSKSQEEMKRILQALSKLDDRVTNLITPQATDFASHIETSLELTSIKIIQPLQSPKPLELAKKTQTQAVVPVSSSFGFSKRSTFSTVNFLAVRFLVSTSVLKTWHRSNSSHNEETILNETKITLIPCIDNWVTGAELILTRLFSASVGSSWQVSLTPVVLIPYDHDIVSAIQSGDFAAVRKQISQGKVHPSSRFPDNSTLVHKCISITYSAQTHALFRNVIEIAEWLVQTGNDVDARDIHGENTITAFSHLSRNHNAAAISLPNLQNLGISILNSTHSSPHFSLPDPQNPHNPTPTALFATELQSPLWQHFLRIIAAGSTQGTGVLVLLSTLQLLWTIPPYHYQSSGPCLSIPVSERVYWTRELMRTVLEEKLWITGGQEMQVCLGLVGRAVRGAMVVGSPWNPDDRDGQYKAETAGCMAAMLQFDERVIGCEVEGESLGECAVRWGVVDLWREALSVVGYEDVDEIELPVRTGGQDGVWERLCEEVEGEKGDVVAEGKSGWNEDAGVLPRILSAAKTVLSSVI